MEAAIGWTASALLLATISYQTWCQWQSDGEGASPWLFIGQAVTSTLFVIYSVMSGDPVFITTNILLLLTALFGVAISPRSKLTSGGASEPATSSAAG